jgi:hypothetical protein
VDSVVYASDVAELARGWLGEYYSSGAFSDNQMMLWVERAQKEVVKKIRWPEALLSWSTVPGVQEYAFQEPVRVKRVYIQGQPIIRTDFATLEGRQIEMYDQTAQGTGPAGTYEYGEPSANTQGGYVPQWSATPGSTYPVNSAQFGMANFAAPWYSGSRPKYYFRGGIIGFVPYPMSVSPVQAAIVKVPNKITSLNDMLIAPDGSVEAMAWLVVYWAYFQDRDNSGAAQLRTEAMANYREQLSDLWRWVKRFEGDGPNGPKIRTGRWGGRYSNSGRYG